MINVNELTDYGFIQFNIKDVDENLYNEPIEMESEI